MYFRYRHNTIFSNPAVLRDNSQLSDNLYKCQYRTGTDLQYRHTTIYITKPVQIFVTGTVPFLVSSQYRQTTPSRVKFWMNTSTQLFSTRYYASTTPVPTSTQQYWHDTKPVVNFHLGERKWSRNFTVFGGSARIFIKTENFYCPVIFVIVTILKIYLFILYMFFLLTRAI